LLPSTTLGTGRTKRHGVTSPFANTQAVRRKRFYVTLAHGYDLGPIQLTRIDGIAPYKPPHIKLSHHRFGHVDGLK
jgi:hypothetical protein